eukprot:scaffold5674_cov30-Phaeocystis_antarctica.AAC.1
MHPHPDSAVARPLSALDGYARCAPPRPLFPRGQRPGRDRAALFPGVLPSAGLRHAPHLPAALAPRLVDA